jgi:hypothetical protein
MNKRDEKLIDEMEAIRSRNNVNWMDILRVALREAPEETRILLAGVSDCDGRVQNIIKKIAEGGDGD